MGASLSIVKSFEVKQIYEFSFLYGLSIAELEYLYRRFLEVQALKTPLPYLLSRVLTVLFHTDDISMLTFEAFLQVFNSWKVSSTPDKLERKSFLLNAVLFKVLDIDDDGMLSLVDIAYFCPETDVKVGERVIILKDDRAGTIRWKGLLKGKTEQYYGIELDNETGKNNGSFQGKVYFKCDEGKGIFISPKAVASDNMLSEISQAISNFTKENMDTITLESFKTATPKLAGLMDMMTRDILPKELSELA